MGRLHPRAHFLDLQLANGHSSTTSTTTTLISATPASYFALKSDIPKLQLPPREEPTRVQLQRQRLQDQHKRHIVSTTIPGIKTSAAFFNSLRTNLSLHAAPPLPSPVSTPNSMRGSTTSLPPPSPLSTPMAENDSAPEDPLAGVPELKSYLTTDEEERLDALNLIADSVAQQRQAANNALIYHPINLSVLSGVFAITIKVMKDFGYDGLAAAMTCMGIFMIWLVACRYMSQGYLSAAEAINWAWAGENVDLLITKFGDEVIGALLIEWVSGDNKKRGKKAWRGLIKGWTIKLRYRGKGVGVALLEDAVKEAKKKGAESLEFADDHANSKRFLPKIYNAEFDKKDRKGRERLTDLLETTPTKGKKK